MVAGVRTPDLAYIMHLSIPAELSLRGLFFLFKITQVSFSLPFPFFLSDQCYEQTLSNTPSNIIVIQQSHYCYTLIFPWESFILHN